MYEEFFGFDEKPFSLTPNTKFLYLSDKHEAVLRTLLFGIENRYGFLMLTGEVGSGKTTSIRALLNLLADTVETSCIFNPLISTFDLVKSINRDFGNACEAKSVQEQLSTLNDFLLKNSRAGKTAVVIIDEAQNLSFEALEMTRMLSNIETESQKLINIILVGQPELEVILAKNELRQLAQRIQIHTILRPLDMEQTLNYIEHRIHCSGKRAAAHFEINAVKKIFKKSKGIPRWINNICDLSLLAAFSQNTHIIDRKIINRAIKEVPAYVYHSRCA